MSEEKVQCMLCGRRFGEIGLRIHCTKMHPDYDRVIARSQPRLTTSPDGDRLYEKHVKFPTYQGAASSLSFQHTNGLDVTEQELVPLRLSDSLSVDDNLDLPDHIDNIAGSSSILPLPSLSKLELSLMELVLKYDLSSECGNDILRVIKASRETDSSREVENCRQIRTLKRSFDTYYFNKHGADTAKMKTIDIKIGTSSDQQKVSFNFCYEDPKILIEELLSDSSIVNPGSFFREYLNNTDGEGNHVYEEFVSGSWFKDAQSKVRNHFGNSVSVLPILLFSDETTINNWRSRSVKPIVMSIGNFSLSARDRTASRKLLGYFPSITKVLSTLGESKLSTDATRQLKRDLYQSVWRTLLREIECLTEEGPLTIELPNKMGRFEYVPVVACFIGDIPEREKVMNSIGSFQAEMPCMICAVPKAAILNFQKQWPFR
jgi:hypothetical protein